MSSVQDSLGVLLHLYAGDTQEKGEYLD